VSAFDELYQEIIRDHARKPRNTARLDDVPREKIFENPVCGDSIKLRLVTDGQGRVEAVTFDGTGCAISTASASLMTEAVRGLSEKEARSLAESFIATMRGEKSADSLDEMGDLAAFKGVTRFPVRVKCATLAWHAMLATLPEGS
jgi:nitrogen fixation protein NifU and related proteins